MTGVASTPNDDDDEAITVDSAVEIEPGAEVIVESEDTIEDGVADWALPVELTLITGADDRTDADVTDKTSIVGCGEPERLCVPEAVGKGREFVRRG